MSTRDEIVNSGRLAYRAGYDVRDNPHTHPVDSADYRAWDEGFWAEHNDAADAAPVPTGDEDGIEAGYGNWYDQDAVSQGMYDDDPSPYDGNYSEM